MSKDRLLLPRPGQPARRHGPRAGRGLPRGRRRCSTRPSGRLGFDLRAVCFDGPLEQLSRDRDHPAGAGGGVAGGAAGGRAAGSGAARRRRGRPQRRRVRGAGGGRVPPTSRAVIGLVRERGRLSAASPAPGAMAAVLGLADEEVERLCAAAERRLAGQLQLPGPGRHLGQRARASPPWPRRVSEAGGKAIRLHVAGAFHSPLMADAAAAARAGGARRSRSAELTTRVHVDRDQRARDGASGSRRCWSSS